MSGINVAINYPGAQTAAQQLAALTAQFSQLQSESEQAAAAAARFELALAQEAAKADQVRQSLGGLSAAQRAVAAGSNTALRASNAQTRGMAEAVNMATEMALGFGGLSPKLREFSVALAMGGNNAVVMAGALGPVGIGLGLLTGVLPTLITQMVSSGEATDEASSSMRRHARDTRTATVALQQFMATQRAAARLAENRGTFAETSAALSEVTAQRDFIQLELEGARELVTQREARIGVVAAQGGTLRDRQRAQADLERARAAVTSLETAVANAQGSVDRLAGRAQQVLAAEGSTELLAQDALDAEEEAERRARRRGRGGSAASRARAAQRESERELSALGADILGDSDMERAARDLDEEAERNVTAQVERMRGFFRELDAATIEAQHARGEREKELHRERMEQLEELKEKEAEAAEARLEHAREITGRIGDTLQTVAASYIDAFGKAIEGQMTLEEAALAASKSVLKGLGQEMVAIGIRETLEGFANIVSSPPVAASKIPMGIALIGAGVGLGAAGAAIPSGPGGGERPREEPERDRGGGEQTLVINQNYPIVSTGTSAQLARQLDRQIRTREFPTRIAA